MKQLKHMTKFVRSGSQKNRSHSPHFVIATKQDLVGQAFFNKKDAIDWASKNINQYYEIHKDYFVE
jgi:hypothetical protein